MLHVSDKTGRIYKGDRVPVKVIQDNVPLQNYVDKYSSNGKFISYYNAIMPYFGVEGNSVLDEETHTFHDFGGAFAITNSGKNVLSLTQVSGAAYGYSSKTGILVAPLKAGKTYRMSYTSKNNTAFPSYTYRGISKDGVRYTSNDDLKRFVASNQSGFHFMTAGSASDAINVNLSFRILEDCYLMIYESSNENVNKVLNYFNGLMIEEGNTNTDYEPYRDPHTINIDLQSDFTFSPCSMRRVNSTADELIVGDFKGKNLFSGVKVNGVPYGWGNYLVYAVPLKAGTYYMSYGKETTSTFPTYIFLGVSDGGKQYWRWNEIETYITESYYNDWRYLTSSSSTVSNRPTKRLTVVKDCTLIIYADGKTITGFTERFSGFMIEEGTERTEYEPYIGLEKQRGAEYKKRIGYIASYNGEDVGTEWVTTSGDLTYGEQVIYVLPNMEIYTDTTSAKVVQINKSLQQFYRTNIFKASDTQDGVNPSGIFASYYNPA